MMHACELTYLSKDLNGKLCEAQQNSKGIKANARSKGSLQGK